MKLYRSANCPGRWFAYSKITGWVMFPAELDGWTKHQPARGIDPLYLREAPIRLAVETGMPASPEELLATSEAA